MYCDNGAIRCDLCGRFGGGYDGYNSYGTKSYDPPEPYDYVDMCQACSEKAKAAFKYAFSRGMFRGDWVKSKAEKEAAEEANLVWDSNFHKYELAPIKFP